MKGLVLSGLPKMVHICVRLRDLAVPRMGRQKRGPCTNRLACEQHSKTAKTRLLTIENRLSAIHSGLVPPHQS